ncbi:prolyl oligopeptidase family serine peptidase [Corynebacterium breve]|uniref:Prolyl oligopeptidase family serine peptidase n=1 Tax=Corynebacterium breve TaxID=3049799 RepID=A0ABY8VER6_9CORY|nr:prolyl oligopeptidase family serine peptidase [Corynebacterium breve]WIM67979.1 prolyl oligopeptidase family serine peptidase [Corynebacterium breve]
MDTSISPELLDDITAPEALAWAGSWSAKTLAGRDFTALQSRIREVLDTEARIPYVTRRGEFLYNFWRDASHPRGLWRRTTLDSYLSESPTWQVLIDVDALAATEGEDWVWKGAHVRTPDYDRALIRLSRGGADATVIREFDITSCEFLRNGFTLPEAKSDVSWVDLDTVLVGTDTGEESLTSSGYPVEVRTWRRGESIEDSEVFARGNYDDVLLGAWHDPTPGFERTVVARAIDFYNTITSVSTERGLQTLELPTDCEPVLHQQWLFILPRTDFGAVPAGALAVIELDSFLDGSREFTLLLVPDAHTSIASLAFTASTLLVTSLVDVATHISAFELGTWQRSELAIPEASTASVVATSPLDGDEYWINASSFSTPSTLLRNGETAKQAPSLFDDTGLETRQHWAESADGTKIPYFITGDFSLGKRPTLVGGYGGFEVSLTPGYSAVRGISWLEKGYYFVQPNLRGGGEFGPQWHSQVVKTNRHKVWEDHHAVLLDLVARGYCEAQHIGIRGGSNGGLLTSGALVQYPEAFGAAVIQVPLTDMLRYHTLSAGASWMAEYGNPDDPEERAAIEKWSPLHNVSSTSVYPPALVTTSTRDDRVHPAHARTFALALAKAGQPVDYYENTAGGHAGAADNEQTSRVEALIYSWLEEKLATRVSK